METNQKKEGRKKNVDQGENPTPDFIQETTSSNLSPARSAIIVNQECQSLCTASSEAGGGTLQI